MTEKLVALRIRVAKGIEARDEAGQGTLEYVGMIAVAAIVAVAVLTVANDVELGEFFTEQVDKVKDLAN